MSLQFENLLSELSKKLHLSLHVDKQGACSIQLAPQCVIQLQPDAENQNLFLFTKLMELPPGKFRENLLTEALKANNLGDPRPAIFCYLQRTHHLALYQQYPLSLLTGEALAGILGGFLHFATASKEALEAGRAPPQGASEGP